MVWRFLNWRYVVLVTMINLSLNLHGFQQRFYNKKIIAINLKNDAAKKMEWVKWYLPGNALHEINPITRKSAIRDCIFAVSVKTTRTIGIGNEKHIFLLWKYINNAKVTLISRKMQLFLHLKVKLSILSIEISVQ